MENMDCNSLSAAAVQIVKLLTYITAFLFAISAVQFLSLLKSLKE